MNGTIWWTVALLGNLCTLSCTQTLFIDRSNFLYSCTIRLTVVWCNNLRHYTVMNEVYDLLVRCNSYCNDPLWCSRMLMFNWQAPAQPILCNMLHVIQDIPPLFFSKEDHSFEETRFWAMTELTSRVSRLCAFDMSQFNSTIIASVPSHLPAFIVSSTRLFYLAILTISASSCCSFLSLIRDISIWTLYFLVRESNIRRPYRDLLSVSMSKVIFFHTNLSAGVPWCNQHSSPSTIANSYDTRKDF